jgi:hypothetical protein
MSETKKRKVYTPEFSDATNHLHAPKFIYYDESVCFFYAEPYAERKREGHFNYYDINGPSAHHVRWRGRLM